MTQRIIHRLPRIQKIYAQKYDIEKTFNRGEVIMLLPVILKIKTLNMKLSKSSWHYLLFSKTYERQVPENLCPYFWLLLLAIFCFPFNFIWNLPCTIIHWISKLWDKDGFIDRQDTYFNEGFKLSLVINILLICVVSMVGVWFNYHNRVFFIFGILGYMVLVVVGAYFISEWRKKRSVNKNNPYKEPRPNILVEFIKAKYNRYCPKIEWDSKK